LSIGRFPESWSPYLRSLLRVFAAFLFIAHGTQKLFGAPAAVPGEMAVLFCVVWLYSAAAGPGPLDVDAYRHHSRD
jgi:putative oxidoreductase